MPGFGILGSTTLATFDHADHALAAAHGVFVFTGQSISVANVVIEADFGGFVVSGQAATFERHLILRADHGVFGLDGQTSQPTVYIGWPAGVPDEPEKSDYSETMAANLAFFQPDTGPPSTWRRGTLPSTKISGSILMSTAERDLFVAFFRDTLGDGEQPFGWNNPAYEMLDFYMFDPQSPPQLIAIGHNLWRMRFSMLKIGA